MTAKVVIERRENLPMPLIYLASAADLADWQVSQLTWSLGQGYRELSISCFDTASMGFDVADAASAVLKAVTAFLCDHPEVERLHILCGDEAAFRAYCFQWNMFYAARRDRQDHRKQ